MTREVETADTVVKMHRQGYHGDPLPAVNVKVYDLPTVEDLADAFPDLDRSDVERMQRMVYRTLQESFWDWRAPDIARDVFGSDVRIWAEGRMGGWLVVKGLGDPTDWDSDMLDKWEEFTDRIQGEIDYRKEVENWIEFIRANGTKEIVQDCPKCGRTLEKYK